MIIGLTGGIASGKSTVSKYLAEKNFIIYDADKIAKEIFETDEVKKEIILNFGEKILEKNKKRRPADCVLLASLVGLSPHTPKNKFLTYKKNIDRKILKEIVFKDKNKLKILNEIIHPKVYKFFENLKESDCETNIKIFDVPLLFESGIDKLCDKIILVVADKDIQVERIKMRDNISEELAKKIISSQLSNEEKIKKADYIIENNGRLEELLKKVDKFILEIS